MDREADDPSGCFTSYDMIETSETLVNLERDADIIKYWSGYGPFTFTRMFEPRHNIRSNVRTNVRKYVVTSLEYSRAEITYR